MIPVKIIVKGLKPYQDRESGEWKTPVSGLAMFPENTDIVDASKIHNKEGFWISAEELELLQSGTESLNMAKLHEKQDAIMDLTLQSAKLVKEMAEVEDPLLTKQKLASGHSLQNNIALQEGKV